MGAKPDQGALRALGHRNRAPTWTIRRRGRPIAACSDPKLLAVLRAFADLLATLPDPRGVRPLWVLLGTLLAAMAGGTDNMVDVAAFTHDHQAWFRLWLPLDEATPFRDTYLRLVRRLDPETAMQAALWLLNGTNLPGLKEVDPGPGRQGGALVGRQDRRPPPPTHGECLPGAGAV